METPRFDDLSSTYDELLRDPIRDRFTAGEPLFFYERKRDLIRRFFRAQKQDASRLRYLDVGCGRGELAGLLRGDFAHTAGCDVSAGMMARAAEIETRIQSDPLRIPFEDASFDFATAVCVYHHVPPPDRAALTREVSRILRPEGVFCMIEHNPLNPATRIVVGRTPVDADAILLRAREALRLLRGAGLQPESPQYFLYFPRGVYRYLGGIEPALRRIPLGGQFAVFAHRPFNCSGSTA